MENLNHPKGSDFQFSRFEDLKVSTKTFIVMTNLTFDKEQLFECLPITKYTPVQRTRGRKRKVPLEDPNKDLENGSIITVKYEKHIRGVELKAPKHGRRSYWRNSVTIVIFVFGKLLNVKVSRNGKFQMTGCKTDEQAEECVKSIWNKIQGHSQVYTLNGEKFTALYVPAMRNIDFALGFNINREHLDRYINCQTPFVSLLETSYGYTGVNIKIPISEEFSPSLKFITYEANQEKTEIVPYTVYLDQLKPKERAKKEVKERFNTILAFQSGRVILSSPHGQYTAPAYYKFLDIIRESFDQIEERLS